MPPVFLEKTQPELPVWQRYMAPKLDTKVKDRRNALKAKVRAPWLKKPPQECKSCIQTTHDMDRDSPPDKPVPVLWVKKWTNTVGEVLPWGHRVLPLNADEATTLQG